jgi:hypothetical protein
MACTTFDLSVNSQNCSTEKTIYGNTKENKKYCGILRKKLATYNCTSPGTRVRILMHLGVSTNINLLGKQKRPSNDNGMD